MINQTDAIFTICRAYPRTKARKSGWHDWFCTTLDGGTIANSACGFEKSKAKARALATAEAIRINAALPRSESRHIQADQGFKRRRIQLQ